MHNRKFSALVFDRLLPASIVGMGTVTILAGLVTLAGM